jgi:hypothetical protein
MFISGQWSIVTLRKKQNQYNTYVIKNSNTENELPKNLLNSGW